MAAWRKLEGRQVDEAIGEGLVMLDFFQDACAGRVARPSVARFARAPAHSTPWTPAEAHLGPMG